MTLKINIYCKPPLLEPEDLNNNKNLFATTKMLFNELEMRYTLFNQV